MTKEQLEKDLKEKFEIVSSNCFIKKSWLREGIPYIGCFGSELNEDFYWFNEYNGKYYKLPKQDKQLLTSEDFQGRPKYRVPCSYSIELKLDKEYHEEDDANINELTIRDLYCIIQNKPFSNKPFLNNLINHS